MLCGKFVELKFPHSGITKNLRFLVMETKNRMQYLVADYVAKAAWYSTATDSSGAQSVNDSRDRMFDSIPYLKRIRSAVNRENDQKFDGFVPANDHAIGEALMRRFIAEEEGRKNKTVEDD